MQTHVSRLEAQHLNHHRRTPLKKLLPPRTIYDCKGSPTHLSYLSQSNDFGGTSTEKREPRSQLQATSMSWDKFARAFAKRSCCPRKNLKHWHPALYCCKKSFQGQQRKRKKPGMSSLPNTMSTISC